MFNHLTAFKLASATFSAWASFTRSEGSAKQEILCFACIQKDVVVNNKTTLNWDQQKQPSSPSLLSKNGLSFETDCVIMSSQTWKVVWSVSESFQHACRLKQRDCAETLSEGYGKRSSTGTDKVVQLRWIGIWQNVYLRCKHASQQCWGCNGGNSRKRSQHLTACHNQTRSLKM